ncbi:hypothetical protein [Streptomyces sp. NPDC101165]|uniref:hypothetical protein n=1 Tax=Streptomyces sp. NPDC101165 TaxID=3366119 RepID=UPI00381AC264
MHNEAPEVALSCDPELNDRYGDRVHIRRQPDRRRRRPVHGHHARQTAPARRHRGTEVTVGGKGDLIPV